MGIAKANTAQASESLDSQTGNKMYSGDPEGVAVEHRELCGRL